MRCYVCGLTPQDGITLYRQNPKGITGIWACALHNTRKLDPEEQILIDILEEKDKDDD